MTRGLTLHRRATRERSRPDISEKKARRPRSTKKQPVRGIAAFVHVRIAELGEKTLEFAHLVARYLHADQHPAVVAPLIAVVEQADVPVGAHARQKAHQGPRPLLKLEAVEQLVGGASRA